MQIEQEIIRNFCPNCSIKYNPPPIKCPNCGSEDLIPFPSAHILMEEISEETLATVSENSIEESISKPKPTIDPEILAQLKKPFVFITGPAGTGKTTLVSLMANQNPNYMELTSTTGIAAVNLGGRTINSVLKYFNTKSLENIWQNGKLQWALRKIRSNKQVLGIEEISMMDAKQLDLIINAVDEINNDKTGKTLGVHLLGDLCLAVGTKIMMANGKLKNIEDIEIGEEVMGRDSTPRTVIRTTFGEDDMYLVHQTNGEDYTVNSKHEIALQRSSDGSRLEDYSYYRYPKLANEFSMSVLELMNESAKFRDCFVGYKAGLIRFQDQLIHIDPYFLGLWLGDGDSDAPRITTEEKEVIEFCTNYAKLLNLKITVTDWRDRTDAIRLHLSSGVGSKNNVVLNMLRGYKLINNKHIPEKYLFNSASKRLELLAGLIDSDGSWGGNRYRITFCNETLAKQTKQLADQLGFRTGFFFNKETVSWTTTIGGDTWRIPCKIWYKKSNHRKLNRSRTTSVLTISSIGKGKYAGIEVDGDNLFLLADGTVTHNCQLPPVNAPFVFKAEYWPRFEQNTIKLEKIWRQDNPAFITAINQIRAGDGNNAIIGLMDCGVTFETKIEDDFDGTTLIPKNLEVDAYNNKRLSKINSPTIRVLSKKAGKQLSEWIRLIPDELRLKLGAYVMILSNDIPEFGYVNGDTGIIESYDEEADKFIIRLKRTGECVKISRIIRQNLTDHQPTQDMFTNSFTPKVDPKTGDWIIGIISYHPIRLAWASTIHKCLIPETRILASTGIRALQDLQIGDEVVDPFGNFSKIVAKDATIAELVIIETEFGNTIRCSESHKFPTYDKYGDFLGYEIAKNLTKEHRLKISKKDFCGKSLEYSSDFAWLLGILIGDGSYRNRRDGTIEISSRDPEIHNLAEAVLARFNIKLHMRKDKKGSYFISRQFRRQLMEHYNLNYTLSENKIIPKIIFNSDALSRGAFLRGLFDTDGHINKNTIVLTSSSKQLILDTQLLLLSLGIISAWSTQYQKYNGNNYDYWQLRIPRFYHDKFKEKIGFVVEYKRRTLIQQKAPKQNCLEKFRLGIAKVKSVINTKLLVPMIDIEVSNNNLFVAEGIITHNSQGLSLDRVQIDTREQFFGEPGMAYVAISRVRTPEGLVLVGRPQDIVAKIRTNKEVTKWV